MKVQIDSYHIENFKQLYFMLRDEKELTPTHIKNVMEELSAIYYNVTGIDLYLEENDVE